MWVCVCKHPKRNSNMQFESKNSPSRCRLKYVYKKIIQICSSKKKVSIFSAVFRNTWHNVLLTLVLTFLTIFPSMCVWTTYSYLYFLLANIVICWGLWFLIVTVKEIWERWASEAVRKEPLPDGQKQTTTGARARLSHFVVHSVSPVVFQNIPAILMFLVLCFFMVLWDSILINKDVSGHTFSYSRLMLPQEKENEGFPSRFLS